MCGGVTTVVFLPDGETLASGSRDDTIRLWNLKTGKHKATLTGHSGGVHSIAFTPDGKMLASGGWKKNFLWNAKTGERLATLAEEAYSPTTVVFSPSGKTLASWSESLYEVDGTIRLWNASVNKHDRKLLTTFKPDEFEER